jgi:hypothetical protein
MFAAVFFVSVGMLIDPRMIVTHWHALALLTGVLIVGKLGGVTLGAILAGTTAARRPDRFEPHPNRRVLLHHRWRGNLDRSRGELSLHSGRRGLGDYDIHHRVHDSSLRAGGQAHRDARPAGP